MFGFSEEEMSTYDNIINDYAEEDLVPYILSEVLFMGPAATVNGEKSVDIPFIEELVSDIAQVIQSTVVSMAYEYAELQCDLDIEESEIIKILHNEYERSLVGEFISHGIAFTSDIPVEIVGDIIIQLPYFYLNALESESVDTDKFFEDKFEAYAAYIEENFPDDSEEGDYDY